MNEQETLSRILEILHEIQTQGSSNSYKIVLFLVPIFGIVFGSALLFFLLLFWHKQRMELIRTGQYKPWQLDLRVFSFFLGLLLAFVGAGLSLVFIIVLGKSLAMLGGLIPFTLGLSLLSFYKLQK
ncbi:MAG TPA: hypothetical protein PKN56_18050 [Leptospiraceae bacterium]|nr:hypothetical protein [Leptospiraceae bacterium]HNN05469.1 hypothetical protein [Leptospiraceae bacterium]